MASLFAVRGRDQGKHFQLEGSVHRLGRESANTIQIQDSEASRKHAEIRDRGDGFELIDLGSSNGTKVNGARIKEHRLISGDRIEIGSTLLIFTGTGPATAAPAASSGEDIEFRTGNDASHIVSSFSQSSGSVSGDSSVLLSETDRSLEVIYLTAIAVGQTDDLDEVLARILRLVFDWIEADRGCIMLRDPDSETLKPAARCDRDGGSQSDETIAISRTILDYVLTQKQGVRTSDAREDQRFDATASIVQAGVREAICVPLQGRFRVVGTLYVDTYTPPGEWLSRDRKQRFTDDHLRLITAIGHQAALAIEDTFHYSALVQSERLAAMGQTIATLSHHVKNILQGMRGGGYLISKGLEVDDTDAVRRGWNIVDRNQERISNLVMDMLTFSKERRPDRVEADLNATINEVVEMMAAYAADAGVRLSAKTEALPLASFDPEAMHRALMNLVSNAIDAASGAIVSEDDFELDEEDPGDTETVVPSVEVTSTYDDETGWIVCVIDSGPGIPPENRQSVFSPFASAKGSRGTGLGLPVSAKIMHEHDGTIEVDDAPEGSGACFRLVLPPSGTAASDSAGRETIA